MCVCMLYLNSCLSLLKSVKIGLYHHTWLLCHFFWLLIYYKGVTDSADAFECCTPTETFVEVPWVLLCKILHSRAIFRNKESML